MSMGHLDPGPPRRRDPLVHTVLLNLCHCRLRGGCYDAAVGDHDETRPVKKRNRMELAHAALPVTVEVMPKYSPLDYSLRDTSPSALAIHHLHSSRLSASSGCAMDLHPLLIIDCAPKLCQDGEAVVMSERDRLRSELREAFNEAVEKHTGKAGTHMHYSPDEYAEIVVIKPGTPRLEPATVMTSPLHEQTPQCPSYAALLVPTNARTRPFIPAPVLFPSVHHPQGFELLGYHPTLTQPSATTTPEPGKRKRSQRSDIKKHRKHRKVKGDLRKLPPKRGVTSKMYVLWTALDPAAENTGVCGVEAHEMASDDPIKEFLSSDGSAGLRPEGTRVAMWDSVLF
ncbi:hypothetical protein NUW54_g7238 [Trametes sanguinea]|uniref:Uncharacterized protein n=1 Tax=Trametes sanguinea TaxID=158606 RepID=A0ACC1PQK0_9APHY|nr:hypothetical protein NUW54_g7238 [Trametes sanguinea]